MSDRFDRLYELLPVVYRQRDEGQRFVLRDLLRVIGEQAALLEDDIASMYEDWFIETCSDWVVPYIGDLVGYQMPAAAPDTSSPQLNRALAPRRAVANHLRDLRRRGTLSLYESLTADAAGLSARAVEFFQLLGRMQELNALDERGRFVDLRNGDALDRIDGAFDSLAHTVDMREIAAARTPGHHNIPNAAAWVWRLRSYVVTDAPAFFIQRGVGYFFYTFSALGNDAPLFTKAERENDPTAIAGEVNVPSPIRRRALEDRPGDFYGADKSFAIWLDDAEEPVPVENIIAADLSDWTYRPPPGKVIVDPKLGRFAIAKAAESVRVTYRYGFPGDIGAHESPRPLSQARDAVVIRVGRGETHTTLESALAEWTEVAKEKDHVVIEITDSNVYSEPVDVELRERTSLQIRAANRCRPVLHLLDRNAARGESLRVMLHDRARFTLDGLVVAGRPLRLEGSPEQAPTARVTVRRCTFVPGWEVDAEWKPSAADKASLDITNLRGHVTVDRCILGTIGVMNETTEGEPIALELRDSIVDALAPDNEAVMGPGPSYAWTALRILRCTVVGRVLTHAIDLAENSIFDGVIRVARRQRGCVRFCYVTPESRTPRRYHCQPDLVEKIVREQAKKDEDVTPRIEQQRLRVAPRFNSRRFGTSDYFQLALDCAIEIREGADDESEMGAWHDLFLPQRLANLRSRLNDATPAGMRSGIIYAD